MLIIRNVLPNQKDFVMKLLLGLQHHGACLARALVSVLLSLSVSRLPLEDVRPRLLLRA